jgi:hypothetical protein
MTRPQRAAMVCILLGVFLGCGAPTEVPLDTSNDPPGQNASPTWISPGIYTGTINRIWQVDDATTGEHDEYPVPYAATDSFSSSGMLISAQPGREVQLHDAHTVPLGFYPADMNFVLTGISQTKDGFILFFNVSTEIVGSGMTTVLTGTGDETYKRTSNTTVQVTGSLSCTDATKMYSLSMTETATLHQ